MNSDVITPFVVTGTDILTMLVGGDITQGSPAERSARFQADHISVIMGVSGMLHGQVILGMGEQTAANITEAMTGATEDGMDEMMLSAIGELGNMITGNAMALLAEAGYHCEMTPPTIVQGVKVDIGMHNQGMVVPILTQCGNIDINIALIESKAA